MTIFRDALIPTIIISTALADVPSHRHRQASLASCFGSALKIDLAEYVYCGSTRCTCRINGKRHRFGLKTRVMRDLNVRGSSMLPGLLPCKCGCMASDASVCGYASTNISLIDQLLRSQIAGGRAVGEDTNRLDASSADPDDLAALPILWTCTAQS